ncbi:unnamed protein product [Urochloa humidicola]
MALSDPNTRPKEETIFVPSSFELERDARDWEECTLVPWAMHLPRGAGAQEIEDLLLDKLNLERGAITVTIHQPEPFLIRFEQGAHCEEACQRGRFKGRGIEICLRRWRSLETAFGMRLFFRVRLYLDGIPAHAWTPNIVERVIGNRCALQCINTDLVQPLDTRHIDLWAWTANPSAIPKKVWLVFTHRPSDRSTARVVIVNERYQPERWQQGTCYPVFLHVGLVEDYSAVADNLHGAVNNPAAFTPIRRPYVWHYGIEDGAPPGTRPRYPARIPRPPTVHDDHSGRRGQDEADHPRRDRARDERDGGSAPRRTSGRSCWDADFTWPQRHDDNDEDDHYDHPGRGGEATRRGQRRSADPVRRERTRSPRRRDAEFRGGRRRAADDDVLPRGRRLRLASHACLRTLAMPLPQVGVLQSMSTAELQNIFKAKATELKNTLQMARGACSDDWLKEATDYITKACDLVGNIGIATGNAAWSGPGEHLIPSSVVFNRLKKATAPSVAELEQALLNMELRHKLAEDTTAPRLTAVEAATAVAATTAAAEGEHNSEAMGIHQASPQATSPAQQGGTQAGSDWAGTKAHHPQSPPPPRWASNWRRR